MAIGAPDLVAQKILGSGNEGFGEGAVLPYRKTDDPLLNTLDRISLLKAQHQKENADNLADQQKRLPAINRKVQDRQLADRQALTQYGADLVSKGINVANHPGYLQAVNDHVAKVNAVNQHEVDYNQKKAEIGQLGEFVNKPVLLKKLENEYETNVAKVAENNDYSGVQKGFTVSGDDPDAFDNNKFLATTTKAFGDTIKSDDKLSNGPYGQMITQVKDRYKFKTDENGKIDKGVINHFLSDPTNDPNMLQYRAAQDKLANTALENAALTYQDRAQKGDQNYSGLAGKSLSQIKDAMYNPKSPYYFDKDAYKEEQAQRDLSPYQDTEHTRDLSAGHAYPKPEKSDAEKSKIIFKPAYITSNTAVMNGKIGANGEMKNAKQVGTKKVGMPGGSLTLPNGKSPIIDVNPDHFWDTTNGRHVKDNKDAFDMEVTGVGLTMLAPDGNLREEKTGIDGTIKSINEMSLKDLIKRPLIRVAFGNIVDKANTTGDSDQAIAGSIPKKQATIHNKRIYIPLNEGHLDTQKINSATGDQSSVMTPEMQKLQNAYDNRFKTASDEELIEVLHQEHPDFTDQEMADTITAIRAK